MHVRRSVPVPKKTPVGICETTNFRGIALTSTVSKVMCTVLNNRLSCVAEDEGLIAEEQAGFRKHRGCRDQVLALVLLSQMEVAKRAEGMMVAFIDFSKAYDRVDRGRLWRCLEGLGIGGGFLQFLRALYDGTSCRVKVDNKQSDKFPVTSGLRQGCVMSPLLFSLYINTLIDTLKKHDCGIQCGNDIIPGLLFADDTAMLAPDEEGLTRSLNCMVQWCAEWGVKINVAKCGIMHVRKKTMKRSNLKFVIDGEEVPVVSSYKYLGCIVDEFLEMKEMIEDKAMAGKKALGAWFQRCTAELGDIGIGTFRKLMTSLVDSTMLYGAEVWGCCRNLQSVQQVQLRAARLFFGVGTLHPRTSLLLELGDLPVVWLARMKCMVFWLTILTSAAYDGRLLKRVSVEAIRLNKGTWIKKMTACCNDFGWQNVGVEQVKDMSENELKRMLESVAWRRVRKEWSQELENKPKLSMLKKIAEYEEESSCANVKMKSERRILIKLRGGTAPFQMETGRWHGLKREERVCKECDSGEVEDVVHWMIRCPVWIGHREALLKQCHDHSSISDEDTTARILCLACHNHKTASVIHTMWKARFGT